MNNLTIKIYTILLLTLVISKTNAQTISAGGWHSISICNDGTVKAFGENNSGQLGNGLNTDSNVPVAVSGLTNILAVSGGGDQNNGYSMALKNDGTVYAWGSNLYGALGNGTTGVANNSSVPVQSLISDVYAISAGGWFSVALKNDGTVWTWGHNSEGQLGNGNLINTSIPVQVAGLTNVVQIVAGTYHFLALKNDGTVWACGDNVSGQIGNGNTGTDATTPVQVSGLTNVIKIDAGRFFSLAVKNDGTLWTWGENLYGQLGNGSNTDSNVPVQVTGLSGINPAIVAAGDFHCMVVKNDGTIWSWGRNTYGNLGDNTTINSNTPLLVAINAIDNQVAAGTNFTLMSRPDGTFWACGRNASGQLGDGTNAQRNVATQATSLCQVSQFASFPLPLSIVKFNAQNKGNYNQVEWTINGNDHIAKFLLQSSPNATEFNTISTIENNRILNSGQELSFNYKDFNFAQETYYRIIQEDIDGSHYVSNLVKVITNTNLDVKIYPNPTTQFLTITGLNSELVTIDVKDALGHTIVYAENYNASTPFQVSTWSSGIYFLHIKGKQTNSIHRIIKK
jgi:alpha-tubulin suppressor-like RCC1 family protein